MKATIWGMSVCASPTRASMICAGHGSARRFVRSATCPELEAHVLELLGEVGGAEAGSWRDEIAQMHRMGECS
jgi:hypothetical protein